LKLDLKGEDLFLLIQALESVTIRGKDAPQLGKLLIRIQNAFEKESTKGE
tara:strand:- start:237 stop:386 length:150 start_codon:yes stop_codon:yes gene_type:complete